MKKFGFFAVLSAMAVSLSVWGGGQNAAPANKGDTSIKVLIHGNVQSFLPGEDENNNEMHTYLEKNSGYKLNWGILPAEAAAARQKLTLEFASGDPSDMIILQGRNDFLQFAADGYLMALDDYIAKNERLKATDCISDPYVKALGVLNGKQYSIVTPTTGSTETFTMAGLKKYIDPAKIGKGDMSLNHVLDVLGAAKKAYPDKITLTGAGSGMNSYMLPGFQWLYGAFGVAAPWREISKGKLEYAPTTRDMRDCLAFIADINAKAYLDPEYPTLKLERVREKMLAGDVVFANIGQYTWPAPASVSDGNKNPLWEIFGNAVGAGGRKGQVDYHSGKYVMVPKSSKVPEAAVDFMGLLCQPETYDFISYGEKDIDYKDMPDGTRINLGTNRRPTIGTNYSVYYRVYENTAQRNFRMLYAVPNDKWGETRIKTHFALQSISDPIADMPVIPLYVEKITDINDLCAEYFLKIATGVLPVSAFDEFLKRFDAIGGNDFVNAVNAWYSKK
jgi:putative aldouronate transport system substrate-binding protein